MSGLHQTGEHERERKRAKKVNKQREKDKRGGTANNWPSTFQFAHSTVYLIDTGNFYCNKILSVIIAPLENTRKPKRGLNGHPRRPRRTEK